MWLLNDMDYATVFRYKKRFSFIGKCVFIATIFILSKSLKDYSKYFSIACKEQLARYKCK